MPDRVSNHPSPDHLDASATLVEQPAEPLDVTNRFVLDFARAHGGRVLDYGCGAGGVVENGLASNVDIWGADVFYGGSTTRNEVESAGMLGLRIREITNGEIPFDSGTFDLVVNNQVMEHVEDLDATLREIHRVLKPGGTVLSLFPSRDVWREGHIGIPFAHRMPRGRGRLWYAWALRSAGFGKFKHEAASHRQWAEDKLQWVDRWTRYRSRKAILGSFDRYFDSELRESDYIRYRLRDRDDAVTNWLASVTDLPVVGRLERALFRKLAFLVIVSAKRPC